MLGRLALSAGRQGAARSALASAAAASWPSPATASSSLLFQSSAAAAAAAATPSSTSTTAINALARTCSSSYLSFSSSARESGEKSSSDDEGQGTARPKVCGKLKDEKTRNHFLGSLPPWPKRKNSNLLPSLPRLTRSLLPRTHHTKHYHRRATSSRPLPPAPSPWSGQEAPRLPLPQERRARRCGERC